MFFFFFNVTPTTGISTYLHTLSLPAALPISLAREVRPAARTGGPGRLRPLRGHRGRRAPRVDGAPQPGVRRLPVRAPASSPGSLRERLADVARRTASDRKSTRLNSSH